MDSKLDELLNLLGQVDDLNKAAAVLAWDQQAYMPPEGARGRASQMATLSRLAHEHFTSDRVGYLLDDLAAEISNLPYDDDTVSMVRVAKRDFDKAAKLPSDFVGEHAEAVGLGTTAWAQARGAN